VTIDVTELRAQFKEPHHLMKTTDNKILFLWVWEPYDKQPKNSAILLLHGITAYARPYELMVRPLAKRGFTIYGLDLRGHGLSDGIRGDYPSKERLIKDLCEAVSFVNERHEKVVILGHSLGVLSSLIILNNCLDKVDGAVLLSGARTTKTDITQNIPFIQKAKIALSSLIRPSRPVIKYEREGQVGLDDPLFNFRYTLRFMRIVALRQMQFPKEMSMPVFIGIGDNDELFSVEDCKKLFDEVPSTVKQFYVAKGGKHAEFPPGSWDPLGVWLEEHFD
jgi:acylglycerol lipase